MPDRAMRPCAHRGCAGLTRTRYCEAHQGDGKKQADEYRAKVDERRGNAAERGYDSDWMKLRAWYLARHPMCEDCLAEGNVTVATLVHHVVPISRGGARLDERNLRAMCERHHDVAHADKWKGRPRG